MDDSVRKSLLKFYQGIPPETEAERNKKEIFAKVANIRFSVNNNVDRAVVKLLAVNHMQHILYMTDAIRLAVDKVSQNRIVILMECAATIKKSKIA